MFDDYAREKLLQQRDSCVQDTWTQEKAQLLGQIQVDGSPLLRRSAFQEKAQLLAREIESVKKDAMLLGGEEPQTFPEKKKRILIR